LGKVGGGGGGGGGTKIRKLEDNYGFNCCFYLKQTQSNYCHILVDR
jgi:hypothetical protein